jgi:hypothetical protein
LTTVFLAQLVVLSHTQRLSSGQDVPSVLAPAAAFVGVIVILNMPLRDPKLPNDDISPPFSEPTATLRSPEDNLTIWQYMSVSWMAPLIKRGIAGKIDDENVWDLGYEFKHERLHNSFRALKGSVTRRILIANGADLVRTTTLSLIQLVASTSSAWR